MTFCFTLGLGLEGWYITKNLLVEISLLLVGYISGVKAVQVSNSTIIKSVSQRKELKYHRDLRPRLHDHPEFNKRNDHPEFNKRNEDRGNFSL